MIEQSARAVVMIRPRCFFPNPETAPDNAFQKSVPNAAIDSVSEKARREFDDSVARLERAGIIVHVFDDTASPSKPDAVFPNNWFSTHADGRVVLYPMFTPSRRNERRAEIIDRLRERYRVAEVVDYSFFEKENLFLEGTGSMVLDHLHRIAYVSLSQRSHEEPLQKFCADFEFTPITFTSTSGDGRPVYHTNVMLCIGTNFALVGLEMIGDPLERKRVRESLVKTGHDIVELAAEQIENFAGNALELGAEDGRQLVLSERAANSLTSEQREQIERYARLLPLRIPTIELGGGSARCMLASVHLPPR